MRQNNRMLGACVCLLLFSSGLASAYDYPFADPYVATVLGTPPDFMADLPKEVPPKHDSINMIGGKDSAASILGMPPSTLQSRIKKLGLTRPKPIKS